MTQEEKVRAASRRIIGALDFPDAVSALAAVGELKDSVGMFKVGMQLYYSKTGGHDLVQKIREMAPEAGIMLDLKVCDTTDTMREAVMSVKDLQPRFLTVHAAPGTRHLATCVDAAGPEIGILGVTVLTTVDAHDYLEIAGIPSGPGDLEAAQEALNRDIRIRAAMAERAKCAGIVCSGRDLDLIEHIGEEMWRVTPGVRPAWAAPNDQKRVMTPQDAIRAGASYLVIGRPIMKPPPEIGGRQQAARLVAEEIAAFFS